MVGKPAVKPSPTGAPIALTRYQYLAFRWTVVSSYVISPVVVGVAFATLNDTSPAVKPASEALWIVYWTSFSELSLKVTLTLGLFVVPVTWRGSCVCGDAGHVGALGG